MEHEPGSSAYLIASAIAAVATVIVAWITSRRGKGAAGDEKPFAPQESGEHAHTRDVVHLEAQRIIDRIELGEVARGLSRQSDQLGISAKRLEDRE